MQGAGSEQNESIFSSVGDGRHLLAGLLFSAGAGRFAKVTLIVEASLARGSPTAPVCWGCPALQVIGN